MFNRGKRVPGRRWGCVSRELGLGECIIGGIVRVECGSDDGEVVVSGNIYM